MTSPRPVTGVSLRGLLAAGLGALAALHLVVSVGRAHDWAIEGASLAAAGLVHGVAAVVVVMTRRRRHLIAVCGWLAVTAGALVVTRTIGYPFGPFSGYTPSLSSFDVVVLGSTLVTISLAVGVLLVDVTVLGEPGWRFDTLAPLAVVVAALPGLTTTRWVDDASSVTGRGHVHGSTTSAIGTDRLTWDERSRLGTEVAAARDIALTHPTLSSALADGWTLAGVSAPGAGQLVVDARRDARDLPFDVSTPHGLIYASSAPDAPVVGVQYAQWVSPSSGASGFTGQDTLWHLHAGTCVVDGPSGEYAIPLDEPTTGSGCREVNGRRDDTVSYMLRAWVVPGWENPFGTFAHDHPALR